jgi:hypothetical protein
MLFKADIAATGATESALVSPSQISDDTTKSNCAVPTGILARDKITLEVQPMK